MQRGWVWTVLWLSLPRTALGLCHTDGRELEEGICRIWHGSVFFVVVFKIVEGFFYLSEMPAVCVWAGWLSTCSWVFQQTMFWCGGTGVNLNSANWEGSLSPGQHGWALSSQEGKSSTCPLVASGVHLLIWTLVWGRKIKESLLDSDRPEVNTNQVIPGRRNKTTHLV